MYEQLSGASKAELTEIITENLCETDGRLIQSADRFRCAHYGNRVFFRGLIEFTNYCQGDCYYCGIRHSNENVRRYRMSPEQVLTCCHTGYALGFRSFVLQGGEDEGFSEEAFLGLIAQIKSDFPDCALTLSVGEKSRDIYRQYYNAGAERYLLRHETATDSHYRRLHPKSQSLANRKKCLYNLKEIGFQVGAGFMVGSPFQTPAHLAEDLIFLRELAPHMVGIGPFIPHKDTPFAGLAPRAGEVRALAQTTDQAHPLLNPTITMIALVRCMLPMSMLPSTTALATIAEGGRELAIKAGANVVMPNLSPYDLRALYSLYENKAFSGCEAAESLALLTEQIEAIGFEPSFTRGDHASLELSN